MSFEPKTIVCKDCGTEFEFSAEEQAFFAEKGFQNEPTRCQPCRRNRRNQNNTRNEREMFPAVCSDCGVETMVPFQPRGDKPVYCSNCFQSHK